MKATDIIQIALYIGVLCALTIPFGKYMFKIFSGEKTIMHSLFGRLEGAIYKVSGIDPEREMNWKSYGWAMLAFNLVGFIALWALQAFQQYLPANPQNMLNVTPALGFNTAASFVTNTNWQSYAGETTMSYFVQMFGFTVQNFLSAATGIAVVIALIRGLTRKSAHSIGNFWSDMVKSVVYILLPFSFIFAIILVSQGVTQSFSPYLTAHTLEGGVQTIPLGPAASQISIKMLGTNGGGFFNANSAFPFENPTPISNFLQMLAIFCIPAGLTYTYGKMSGSTRQGWAIFGAMMFMFVAGLIISLISEFNSHGVYLANSVLEGKELRFGISQSVLFSVITTGASCGAVNAMHSSLSPISGMVAMINMMLGEVIFGGVGAGLYGILIFVVVTVFITGLMVGRTPEYLGKKIESFEVKMAILAITAPSFVILLFSAIASVVKPGLSSLLSPGPHGFSEILYAFTSAAANNGSAFAGLNANTDFYNILLGIGMIVGRFGVIIPVLAIAGNMSGKKISPPSEGSFRTDKPLFSVLLVAVILIVGGLTFFPALSLGPIVEQMLMNAGKLI